MKKHMKWLTVLLGLLIFLLCFTSCTEQNFVGITSIKKTASDGLTDTYTITYSDGTTETLTIQNGADGTNGIDGTNGVNGTNGTDGKDITVEALYQAYVEAYGDIGYDEFLKAYLSFDYDNTFAVQSALRTSAKVYAEFSVPSSYYQTRPSIAVGSAVIYRIEDEYTYFITNYHVVYNEDATVTIAPKIHCYMYGSTGGPVSSGVGSSLTYDYGSTAISCTYVGGSVTQDIAVMKAKTADVLAQSPDATAVEFAEDYHVGQTAIAIGNPDDDGISTTRGIVSVEDEFISLQIGNEIREYRCLRIDTPLYSGNSGGGLFNVKGELIGITNAGSGEEENINFAIPVPIVKGAVENIMYHEADGDESTVGVYKLTLGIIVTPQNTHYEYDSTKGYGETLENVLVDEVTSDSRADRLGLSTGDFILSLTIDGTLYTVNRYFDIGDALLYATAGSVIRITYLHGGETNTTAPYTVLVSDMTAVE